MKFYNQSSSYRIIIAKNMVYVWFTLEGERKSMLIELYLY